MAKLHVATVSPTKPELITQWLSSDPTVWPLAADGLVALGAYRFDDPAEAVGIECHLLGGSDGSVLHVPVTYRAEPEASLSDHLVGTLEHSVLGTRWVYDGCADPICVGEFLHAMRTGGTQVELIVHTDDGPVVREPNATVRGSGSEGAARSPIDSMRLDPHRTGTVIQTGSHTLNVRRIVDLNDQSAAGAALLGAWNDQPNPVVLATLA